VLFGAIAGVLTAAVALGVGQLVSGLTVRQGSPAVVVGQAAIDLAPPPVKNFAISVFGANDKTALLIGILVVLAIVAAVIGVAAMRRLAYGYAGLVLFAAIGLAAALSRPDATFGYAVPTIFGAAAGAFALNRLTRATLATIGRTALPAPAAEAGTGPGTEAEAGLPSEAEAAPRAEAGSEPSSEAGTEPTAEPAADREAASEWLPAAEPGPETGLPTWVPDGSADHGLAAAGTVPSGRSTPSPDDVLSGPRPTPDNWTYQPPSAPGPGRRRFLVAGGVAAGGAALAYLAGRELNARQSVTEARSTLRIPRPSQPAPPLAPGTDLHIPGLSSFVTPSNTFYRVDTAIVLPEVDPQHWQLHIHGMVEREVTISFAELLRQPLIEHYVTLTCVSDPVAGPYIGNAKWLGASLASIIRSARPQAGATQLLCTSFDGFTSGTPLQVVLDGRAALLAVAMNGAALPVEHGFPARMVVPGLYGYVSATKWVTDIKVTTYEAETAYWAQRGWSQEAPIKTESRIDVPMDGSTVKRGRTAVAGVAWAQHKGIDAVEVRVDRGAWHQATLAAVPGIDTWRQWVWYWDATPGTHVVEARATDTTGYTQTSVQAPTEPNGATGYPSITATVRA
jgi:DMSO/TMAO reductase YedYZ molybdopterin-dependent catalytic subunit